MATQELPDPDAIDEEIRQVLAENPGLLEELQEIDRQRERGELKFVSHEEVRRRLGLDRPGR
jgi:hypothetical protein